MMLVHYANLLVGEGNRSFLCGERLTSPSSITTSPQVNILVINAYAVRSAPSRADDESGAINSRLTWQHRRSGSPAIIGVALGARFKRLLAHSHSGRQIRHPQVCDPFAPPGNGRFEAHLAALRAFVKTIVTGGLRVGTTKAKAELRWTVQAPTYRDGLRLMGRHYRP
jgi:hypothetical protein